MHTLTTHLLVAPYVLTILGWVIVWWRNRGCPTPMLSFLRSPRARRAVLVYAAILALGGISGVLGGTGVVTAAAVLR